MTQQKREELERILDGIMDAQKGLSISSFNDSYLKPLMNFARQQLNLRVDGQKLREKAWLLHAIHITHHNLPSFERLVLECLTTDPLPTEQKED